MQQRHRGAEVRCQDLRLAHGQLAAAAQRTSPGTQFDADDQSLHETLTLAAFGRSDPLPGPAPNATPQVEQRNAHHQAQDRQKRVIHARSLTEDRVDLSFRT